MVPFDTRAVRRSVCVLSSPLFLRRTTSPLLSVHPLDPVPSRLKDHVFHIGTVVITSIEIKVVVTVGILHGRLSLRTTCRPVPRATPFKYIKNSY